MPENLGFELREPTQDFPFTVILRNAGDGNPSNWREIDGRTLGGLPDLSEWGLELAIQERVEGPEHVVSTALYIVQEPDPDEEDFPGKLPGTLLSKEWSQFDNQIEVRVVPGIDHDQVDWAITPLTPEQMAWIRMKEKLARVGRDRPELEMMACLPGVKTLTQFLMKGLEKKYQINTCRECAHFDEEAGKQEYEQITHTFENGEMAMNKDISQMVSQERHVRNLDETQVGLCTLRETLIERSFRACPKFEKVLR